MGDGESSFAECYEGARVCLRDTEHGPSITLELLDDDEDGNQFERAGTTVYLSPSQIKGMAQWLSLHAAKEGKGP